MIFDDDTERTISCRADDLEVAKQRALSETGVIGVEVFDDGVRVEVFDAGRDEWISSEEYESRDRVAELCEAFAILDKPRALYGMVIGSCLKLARVDPRPLLESGLVCEFAGDRRRRLAITACGARAINDTLGR